MISTNFGQSQVVTHTLTHTYLLITSNQSPMLFGVREKWCSALRLSAAYVTFQNGLIEAFYAQEHFISMSGLKLNHGTHVYLSMQTGLSFAKCLYNHCLFKYLLWSFQGTTLLSFLISRLQDLNICFDVFIFSAGVKWIARLVML